LSIPIEKKVVKIGRDESNDIVIPMNSISSLHATIEFRNGYYYLEDHRSTNGTRLNGLKRRAEAAAAAERWKEAADLYGQVLATDANIQFAITGRAQARDQQRLKTALASIIQSPDKLSSEKLYRDAQGLLEEAQQLSPRGPQLASQIVNVQEILRTYATPVVVTLRSDDRTRITLSTVGELGQFTEKQLQLRPGAYTVIGSRDGCRDVREQILVRPNMLPVDIRCIETL